jgi:hypothetical protein
MQGELAVSDGLDALRVRWSGQLNAQCRVIAARVETTFSCRVLGVHEQNKAQVAGICFFSDLGNHSRQPLIFHGDDPEIRAPSWKSGSEIILEQTVGEITRNGMTAYLP